MRPRLIVANWKLNKSVAEALAFARALAAATDVVGDPSAPASGPCEVVLAPPATALWALREPCAAMGVGLCAQEIYSEDAGAYTGTLSAPLVAEAGASYVLVGHSERRRLFAVSDADCAGRMAAARRHGLQPILCIGEDASAYAAGETLAVVRRQLTEGLAKVGAPFDLAVAYEPVWAIGTGRSPAPKDIAAVHAHLRACLETICGPQNAADVRLLYGGSVTADNVAAVLAAANVDGALVGGASLQVNSFVRLLREARRAR